MVEGGDSGLHLGPPPSVCAHPQFSVFLGLIFFLELATGILVFVFKDWIRDQLNLFINNNVKAYRDDIDLQNLIDFAQEYVSPASSTGPPPARGTCWSDEWEQVPFVLGPSPHPPQARQAPGRDPGVSSPF